MAWQWWGRLRWYPSGCLKGNFPLCLESTTKESLARTYFCESEIWIINITKIFGWVFNFQMTTTSLKPFTLAERNEGEGAFSAQVQHISPWFWIFVWIYFSIFFSICSGPFDILSSLSSILKPSSGRCLHISWVWASKRHLQQWAPALVGCHVVIDCRYHVFVDCFLFENNGWSIEYSQMCWRSCHWRLCRRHTGGGRIREYREYQPQI